MANIRLIDANALAEHIKDLPTWWAEAGGFYGGAMKYPEGMFIPEDIISSIENAPAVDAVEVVHGRLEQVTELEEMGEMDYFKCSVCGRLRWFETNYCPSCGAKMDGGTDNG